MEEMGKDKRKELIVFILLYLITVIAQGQNLVNNPSFEIYKDCPISQKNNNKLGVEKWYSATKSSPDYYNECCPNKKAGVVINSRGNQIPHDGKGYIGLLINNNDNSSEYVQTKLKYVLVKDSIYCVRYYVSLADKSDFYTNDIGILFTKVKIKSVGGKFTKKSLLYKTGTNRHPYNSEAEYFEPQIKPIEFIDNYTDWVEICKCFQAIGGEHYLTIGSFTKDIEIKKSENFNKRSSFYKDGNYVYYYIDDVSVIPVSTAEECPCARIPQPEIPEPEPAIVEQTPFKDTTVGSRVVLNNIYFALNDSTLLDSSYTELKQLLSYLEQHPGLKIEVSGHTDDTGSDAYNQSLSEARARAVVNYLEQKGVASKRLTYKGYGRTQPLINETTETARAKNRRVEFIVR